jgi:hypothetical protein
LKVLEENTEKTLHDMDIDNDFQNRTVLARIDKWDCIKLKSFFTARKQFPDEETA